MNETGQADGRGLRQINVPNAAGVGPRRQHDRRGDRADAGKLKQLGCFIVDDSSDVGPVRGQLVIENHDAVD